MTLTDFDSPPPPFVLERSERHPSAYVFEVTAAPEIIKFAAVDLGAMRRRHTHEGDLLDQAERLDPSREVDALDVLDLAPEIQVSRVDKLSTPRGDIEGWSVRSRMRMIQALGSVEMTGRFAMLTLTYGGDWFRTADGAWRTPDVVRAERAAFRKRYERRWGPLYGAWKVETQRRGAPHLHVSLRLPDGVPWGEVWTWCRRNWHEVVYHPSGACSTACGNTAHLHRGAHMDARFADRVREGRSTIASYFAKHGTWRSKEYQNTPPNVAITQALWLSRLLAPCGDVLERQRQARAAQRAAFDAFGIVLNAERLMEELPDVLEAWETFCAVWSTPGRWWGLWRLQRVETARDDCVDHDVVRVARLICRKVVARRSQRSTFAQRDDGSLLEVPVRRTMRSLHGFNDCGWWMTARDGREFFWWLLNESRARSHLRGVGLARSLAQLEMPVSEPARVRRTPASVERRVVLV